MKKFLLGALLILAGSAQAQNDSTRIPTNSTYTAYGHEFPVFWDAVRQEAYIERKVAKNGHVTRWKIKQKTYKHGTANLVTTQ